MNDFQMWTDDDAVLRVGDRILYKDRKLPRKLRLRRWLLSPLPGRNRAAVQTTFQGADGLMAPALGVRTSR